MNTLLAATTLDDSLQGIVTKLQSLMDSFWNEEKINARDMVKNLIIGIIIIFVIAMGAPLLINGLSAWVG